MVTGFRTGRGKHYLAGREATVRLQPGCITHESIARRSLRASKVDSALDLARRKFQALDQGQAEKAALDSAREIAERTSRTREETAGDLKDAELEQQAVEKKKKDYETKLYSGKVTSPKELMDIQHEIEALGRQRGMLDERILTLMDQVETRRNEAEESERTLKSADSAFTEGNRLQDYRPRAGDKN